MDDHEVHKQFTHLSLPHSVQSKNMEMTVANRFEFDIEEIRANRNLDGALAMQQLQAKQQLNTLNVFIEITEALIVALGESDA